MSLCLRSDRSKHVSHHLSELGEIYDPNSKTWDPNGKHLIRQQDFWFSFGMTVFILIPWFTVREVKVDVEIVSASFLFHMNRLYWQTLST